MSTLRKELTFEGGVNLDKDPHTLKSNEWQLLQNLWPYRDKLLGSRPSLLHEQDILPVGAEYWNANLFRNTTGTYPTPVPYYYQWFSKLTPVKMMFMGDLNKVAMVCVVNSDGLKIREQFEGAAESIVTLNVGECILVIAPNDLRSGDTITSDNYPILSAVRLGYTSNITPSLVEFNGDLIAANSACDYVVRVVKASSLPAPTAALWPTTDYRFTKIDYGASNTNFKPDGVTTYKGRFVYFKGNKLWFSDPYQPEVIYDDAVASAYLAVFFNSGLTESITAATEIYTSTLDTAGDSVLAIWAAHGMIIIQGEPATTIASTAEELFSPVKVTTMPVKAGCISASSIVKTKLGIIWCGADSVWFMAKGGVPVEVGDKIGARIVAQSLASAGRIFATYDDQCYRLVINAPGVGYNPYDALNEMWCLSFIGDAPTKETAAWFGPQVFTNKDNPVVGTGDAGGPSGLYCCAKLIGNNDDKTWYLQPYSCPTGDPTVGQAAYSNRLGLATISTYYGVDITAPFRPVTPGDDDHYYYPGDIIHLARGLAGEEIPYCREYVCTIEGTIKGAAWFVPVYANSIPILPPGPHPTYTTVMLFSKRPMMAWLEAVLPDSLMPKTHKIQIQSPNMTFDSPELVKLISGLEMTFKTLNPLMLSVNWWPWEPATNTANVVTLESRVNVPSKPQNVLDGAFNEPVLTARSVNPPNTKRYNGLTAQLNIVEPEYKIISGVKDVVAENPNWGRIKISTDGTTWTSIQLFEYNNKGIAKYVTVYELMTELYNKVQSKVGKDLAIDALNGSGCGFKFDDNTPLYIDLTGQGWEWFGFVPTNIDSGYGVNIISNQLTPTLYMRATGPIPPCTPHSIHLAKLTVKYRVLSAPPR